MKQNINPHNDDDKGDTAYNSERTGKQIDLIIHR